MKESGEGFGDLTGLDGDSGDRVLSGTGRREGEVGRRGSSEG